MYKTKIIKGDTDKEYEDNLNIFYKENKDIEIINIQHKIRRIDDFIGFITYKIK